MNTNIPNWHVLTVKYIGWSNELPARVKIISERFKHSVTFSFDSELGNDTCEQAEHWLKKNGFNVIGHAEGKGHYYVITDTFEPLKGK
jgi:hypothetical protein